MSVVSERRILQAVVAAACIVPFAAGGAGALFGPDTLRGVEAAPADLDSHYRYLSGLLLGIGIGFASCIPRIEVHSARFRLLAAIVVMGGLARLLGLVSVGVPSSGQLFGLAMELGVVPALAAWQASFALRWREAQPLERA